MARTGYKIVTYLDDNPYSPTYMETYEVREYDDVTCPTSDDNWVLITDECEIVLTGFTGYRIRIYFNKTTSEFREEKELASDCTKSTDEIWVNYGEGYCEVGEDGLYTGYFIQPQRQTNQNLPNYGEIRNQRIFDPNCTEDTAPKWEFVSKTCHISVEDCSMVFDGTADVVEIDVNPKSATYNQTRTVNREDEDCANCTDTQFKWVEIGEMCGDAQILRENGIVATATTKYLVRQRYKVLNGQEYPLKAFDLTPIQEKSEDCGYVGPVYRWTVVDGYICDYETHERWERTAKQISYDNGETWAFVIPAEYDKGQKLEEDSYLCGKPKYDWIETENTECDVMLEDNAKDRA